MKRPPVPESLADMIRGNAIPILASRLDLLAVLRDVQQQLGQVDGLLREQAAQFDPAVVGYVRYVCEHRGKGIRPALALLAGGACGGITPGHITLGGILELIHVATLVHDDVMDRAEMRRGTPTVQFKWGPELAVLLGDSLFAHALKLCTQFDSTRIARRIADAAGDVCQGEILQTQRQFDLNLTLDEYQRIIRMKTAALFSVATELGAFLAGTSEPVVERMRSFGELLGVAYQMYDDCLDLVGSESGTGKTLGTDLTKGKFTLPVLLYLSEVEGADNEKARAILSHGDEAQRMEFVAGLHATGVFARAINVIVDRLDNARQHLVDIPPSSYRKALEQMAVQLQQHLAPLCFRAP
jgi:octaprenyl-diphosphate synthase